MTIDLDKLRVVCEKATSGNWDGEAYEGAEKSPDRYFVDRFFNGENIAIVRKKENAEFISTFNPALVLELLEIIEHKPDRVEWALHVVTKMKLALAEEAIEKYRAAREQRIEMIDELKEKLAAAEKNADFQKTQKERALLAVDIIEKKLATTEKKREDDIYGLEIILGILERKLKIATEALEKCKNYEAPEEDWDEPALYMQGICSEALVKLK